MIDEVAHVYFWTLISLLLLLLMVFVQAVVASVAHASQPNAIAGIPNSTLGHESFVFRSHRTFMNSLENVPFFMALVFLSLFFVINPLFLNITTGLYTFGRFIHMILYYAIATNKNPSPRSYFFMLSILAQIALFVGILVSLYFGQFSH